MVEKSPSQVEQELRNAAVQAIDPRLNSKDSRVQFSIRGIVWRNIQLVVRESQKVHAFAKQAWLDAAKRAAADEYVESKPVYVDEQPVVIVEKSHIELALDSLKDWITYMVRELHNSALSFIKASNVLTDAQKQTLGNVVERAHSKNFAARLSDMITQKCRHAITNNSEDKNIVLSQDEFASLYPDATDQLIGEHHDLAKNYVHGVAQAMIILANEVMTSHASPEKIQAHLTTKRSIARAQHQALYAMHHRPPHGVQLRVERDRMLTDTAALPQVVLQALSKEFMHNHAVILGYSAAQQHHFSCTSIDEMQQNFEHAYHAMRPSR